VYASERQRFCLWRYWKNLLPHPKQSGHTSFSARIPSPLLATSAIRAMQVDYPNYATSRSVVAKWEQNMKPPGSTWWF